MEPRFDAHGQGWLARLVLSRQLSRLRDDSGLRGAPPPQMNRSRLVGRAQHRLRRSETGGPLILAIAVGLLSGLGALLLRRLIDWVHFLFFDAGADLAARFAPPGLRPDWHIIVAPAVGMVIVSAMVRRWAPEARGHGVPEVQFAVLRQGGRIRPRVALVKAVASAISIGSGGSVGREGPIVQIGSGLGSTAGQLTGQGPRSRRILLAGGAAGAIAATFNAPIAGVMFAMEVILGTFAPRAFGLVVVSAVSASALSQAVLGRSPAFTLLERFTLGSEFELLLYLVLGLVMGLLAIAFIRCLYIVEDGFDRWRAHPTVKALAGGLAVGALGYFGSEHIFGVGHEGAELALRGAMGAGVMLSLVILKMLATSITLGAGGSGGVFAPALFIGAMAGGVFGQAVQAAIPGLSTDPGAYALVGMAALFGAAAHAPITAVLILFEMTDDYQIILPLMFSVVVAYLVTTRLYPESVYSIKLRRLGGFARSGDDPGALDLIVAEDLMAVDFESVSPDMSLADLGTLSRGRRTRSWPVLSGDQTLVGIVTDTDLERSAARDSAAESVRDIMTTHVVTCRPADSLMAAFQRFIRHDVQLVPVVEGDGSDRVVGVLGRRHVLRAYRDMSLLPTPVDTDERGGQRDMKAPVQREYTIPMGDKEVAHRRLRELDLPAGVLVALVRRGNRAFVPRGSTKLDHGDVLLLFTTKAHQGELDALLRRWDQAARGRPSN